MRPIKTAVVYVFVIASAMASFYSEEAAVFAAVARAAAHRFPAAVLLLKLEKATSAHTVTKSWKKVS